MGVERWANVEVLPDLREKMFDPFHTLKEPRELREAVWWGGGGGGLLRSLRAKRKTSPSVRMKQAVMVLPSLKSFHKYASSFCGSRPAGIIHPPFRADDLKTTALIFRR